LRVSKREEKRDYVDLEVERSAKSYTLACLTFGVKRKPMNHVAIRIDNLSKRYRIGAAQYRHDTLRDRLAHGLSTLFQRNHNSTETIWALKGVSLEVEQGTVMSIIGRNGSGKSTLLKILSRITEPTSGCAEVYGRVGSVLEVGTGFHSELTGRENIYLNGAILGMKKVEIDRSFDEIVAFAEIEKFVDTPVKHYSSGMYVRLAFAVAAHLKAEILIIDEVLSVGDAGFQKKCLGKVGNIAKGGRTVLFVSHDMTAVTSFSAQAALLEQGTLRRIGAVNDVVQSYLHSMATGCVRGRRFLEPSAELPFYVTSVCTSDYLDNATAVVPRSSALVITVQGEVREARPVCDEYLVALDIKTVDDMLLFRTHNIEQRASGGIPHRIGPFELKCIIPPDLLPTGTYRLGVHTAIAGRMYLQDFYPALEFDVVQDQLVGGIWAATDGILTPRCDWTQAQAAEPVCRRQSAF
jgi:lipopolysaccharide transport system ATP-binding protein